ncbi:DUF2309 domain-containing protein [Bradyrhizobium viridifuturi]|jgi:uncharacterized protein YbcC (UPF0753/DUF2309 family)|nr:DUF2309 domain-containing protein [Bradyrhizobium viridifuturi]MBR1048605.1 DUF2309 domain-containing protein [Bradyrhizobium viridifuturi]MBR1083708.1 DUF2309 domain-containing protein [Bradyrhizobium viridifuturi]MBR1099172.1 DUF2309 domain-containing protein [Bradyrhizobium viridifuturi]MBR1106328.1 DUF2309 domain-containing protein [Bradyrhizobium viridifuturi]
MSLAVALETDPPSPSLAASESPTTDRAVMNRAIDRACNKIAPLWPLKHFVAVNPFLGFSDQSFAATCATLRRVAGVDMLMPRAFYREALSAGTIEERDLEAAIAAATSGHPALAHDAASLRLAAARDPVSTSRPGAVVATVAEVLDGLAAGDRQASRTAFMIDEISKWCAAYFDEGQAAWKLPSRALPAYAAWRAAMRFDRNPETMGIRGFRKAVATMPEDPRQAIVAVVRALGIPEGAVEDYLHRALIDIGGWAAYARYRVWDNALYERDDDTLVELLAIRVVWGYALFLERPDTAFTTAWAKAMAEAAKLSDDERLGDDPELALDLILHEAYEAAYRRRLLARLAQHLASPAPKRGGARKAFQAAFCIDVRSEVYRRALETVCPEVETIGFAGFFGFPIEYVPIGRETGGAQCPVLLKPAFVVCEAVAGASQAEETRILGMRLLRRRAAKAWKAFKLSAVSSFTYVETAGLLFAGKLVGDTARLTRTVSDPNTDGLDAGVIGRIGPRLEPRALGDRITGFDEGQRLAMAEAVLRAMSMTQDFARLVLLTGHGSTTVNNPHASGLDCGACGGHTGEANARVAAAILNDPGVRAGLAAKGIVVPRDTWFLGCLHDTTTDCIRVYETDQLPPSHADDLARLRESLAQASSLARAERALLLGIGKDENVDRAVKARSRDWAQVRPEWGLAGNAAFIAAPRARTRRLDLAGRAFLHDYDWRKDTGFGVLELIMTAPMVVASWINLQYYGSTVNNRAFGSGNKVLHNVVSQLGVLEGNAGDLKVGLPWQSVHDGVRLMHEPLRLNVLIEAPEEALNRVIETHAGVRQLVDNRWVHLFCLGEDGRTFRRYAGDLRWGAVE